MQTLLANEIKMGERVSRALTCQEQRVVRPRKACPHRQRRRGDRRYDSYTGPLATSFGKKRISRVKFFSESDA
jgi:hypothetical protein